MLGSGSSYSPTRIPNFIRIVSPNFRILHMSPEIPPKHSGVSAWKRVVELPLASDSQISLITAIFSDRDETEVVRDLRGDDAQSFVEVIDEVGSGNPTHLKRMESQMLCFLRCWMSCHRGSEEGA